MLDVVRESVRRAVDFLDDAQRLDGGFRLGFWSPLASGNDVVSPFTGAVVLLALDGVAGVPPRLRSRAIAHLMSKRESCGLVRFIDGPIDPDYDDICLVHSLLQNAGIDLDFRSVARRVGGAMREDGLFPTWLGVGRPPELDPVVNVNIVRFLDRNGVDCSRTIPRLQELIARWTPGEGTLYYPPPGALPWMVCTLPTELRARIIGGSRDALLERIGHSPNSLLDRAMRTFSLARLGAPAMTFAAPLLDAQASDGGWPADAIFGPRPLWGSRELNTAIAASALAAIDFGTIRFAYRAVVRIEGAQTPSERLVAHTGFEPVLPP